MSTHQCYPWVLQNLNGQVGLSATGSSVVASLIHQEPRGMVVTMKSHCARAWGERCWKGQPRRARGHFLKRQVELPIIKAKLHKTLSKVTALPANSTYRHLNKQFWLQDVSAEMTYKWTRSVASTGEVGLSAWRAPQRWSCLPASCRRRRNSLDRPRRQQM